MVVRNLVDVSDIFYFFCSGEGGRSPTRREGGGGAIFEWKIPGEGGLPGGWGRGGEGPGGCLRGIGGGGWGAKYFFSGPKCPPRKGVTLVVGIEMSFFGIKILRSSFRYRDFLTSNVPDVEAPKTGEALYLRLELFAYG